MHICRSGHLPCCCACRFRFLGCRWLEVAANHSMLLWAPGWGESQSPDHYPLNASDRTWHVSLLVTFHWPKQVTLPGIHLRRWGSEVSHKQEIEEELTLVNAHCTIEYWIANVSRFLNNVQNADFLKLVWVENNWVYFWKILW